MSKVKVVGFDGMPEGKQAIKDGKIYADPIQFPDEIGKKTVQCIVKYVAGKDIEPSVFDGAYAGKRFLDALHLQQR